LSAAPTEEETVCAPRPAFIALPVDAFRLASTEGVVMGFSFRKLLDNLFGTREMRVRFSLC
jgi:hypothetical protein